MHFRGGSTIKELLVHLKDRDTILQKSRVIYRYKCSRVDCEEVYIGESDKTFAERFREQGAILIRVNDLSLNRNISKYQLHLNLCKQSHNIWALVTYLLLPTLGSVTS